MARITDRPSTEEKNHDQESRKRRIEYGDPEGDPGDPGSAHAGFDRRLRLLEGGKRDPDGIPWYGWAAAGIIAILVLAPGASDWIKARAGEIGKQGPWAAP